MTEKAPFYQSEQGKMRREITAKIRFHRHRIQELVKDFTEDEQKFLVLLGGCDGDGAEVINDSQDFLPRPVVRDGNSKLIKDHTPSDFFLKLQEEIFEVIDALNVAKSWENSDCFGRTDCDFFAQKNYERAAEEIADVITVCISYLDANGYDEEKRSELFVKINEKNEKRGYFEEKNFSKGE